MIPAELRSQLGEALGGVFYLHGEDDNRKGEVARALVDAHLEPSIRDFNHDLLRGSEVDTETLASVLGTPPMMSDWRVVEIRDVQALASSARARTLLAEVVASPPEGLALVLLCDPGKSTARFYRDLQKVSRSMAFTTPNPNDLPGWLMDRARSSLQCELEEDAARALAHGVGSDSALLARELEKLATLVGEGGVITKEVVASAGTRIPRQDRWKWFDLVGEARFGEAMRGLPVLLQHGETGVGLTVGLATHLLRVAIALDGGRSALEAILPSNQGWLAGRLAGQARHWTLEEIQEALSALLTVDQLLKSGSMSEAHLLEGWILGRMVSRKEAA